MTAIQVTIPRSKNGRGEKGKNGVNAARFIRADVEGVVDGGGGVVWCDFTLWGQIMLFN